MIMSIYGESTHNAHMRLSPVSDSFDMVLAGVLASTIVTLSAGVNVQYFFFSFTLAWLRDLPGRLW